MIDILDQSVAEQIITELEASEALDRKKAYWDAQQIYEGNLKYYIEQELERTRPKSWDSYSISNVSLSRMVIKKLARAYVEQPMRSVENDRKNEALEEIYKEGTAKIQLKEFDEIYNLHRHALMWVNYRPEFQKWQYMALSPFEYDVVLNKDDPTKLECVILKYPDSRIVAKDSSNGDSKSDIVAESQIDGSAQSAVYAMWTDKHHVVWEITESSIQTPQGTEIKKDITYVPLEGNPNNINPVGVIPFVYKSMHNGPDYPTINPITEQTVTYNALNSELLTAANIQGVGVGILSYSESMIGQIDRLNHGLTSLVELPQPEDTEKPGTSLEYISPSPALEAQKSVYTNYLRQVLSEHGITAGQGLDGSIESFSSGLERAIANADTQNQIKENQQTYTDLEKKMFEITKAWDKLLGKNQFSKNDELSIAFPKPKTMITDKETLENIEKRLNLGLMERWEALIILDPNLSETEAKIKIEEIDAEKAKRASMFPGFSQDPFQVESKEQKLSEIDFKKPETPRKKTGVKVAKDNKDDRSKGVAQGRSEERQEKGKGRRR